MCDKNVLIEWVFFKLVWSATSDTTSNPRPRFSRVLSVNKDSKYLSNLTRISKASSASHNTILKKASANWRQFSTADPNFILFTIAVPSDITVASEMACSPFVCDAVAFFIYSLPHALRQPFFAPKIVYHYL